MTSTRTCSTWSCPATGIGLQIPGAWKPYKPEAGVKLDKMEGDNVLTVPAVVAQVRLVQG